MEDMDKVFYIHEERSFKVEAEDADQALRKFLNEERSESKFEVTIQNRFVYDETQTKILKQDD